MKKFLVGLTTLAVMLVVIPMFSAFEAHVINVTAKIENALSVDVNSIKFGTVFPQEHLEEPMTVSLSQSFIEEDRVDSVDYFIRQKPKCAWTWNDGQDMDESTTATGHVQPDGEIDCGEEPDVTGLPEDAEWGVLPSLCEYISKEGESDNDETTPSFHTPWTTDGNTVSWLDTDGLLTKDGNDLSDTWTIDLAVPCFGGYCAQDWASFVHGINPNANPDAYTQDIADQHKIFGCDLWVEVSGVEEGEVVVPPPPPTTASLTIIKAIQNDDAGGTVEDPNAFLLTVNGAPVSSGVATNVTPGTVKINESQLVGYEFVGITGDPECPTALDTDFTLNAGDDVTCTITNTDVLIEL